VRKGNNSRFAMKTFPCLLTVLAGLALPQSVFAGSGPDYFDKKVVVDEETSLFRDMEFQIDAFGAFINNTQWETRGHTLNTGVGGGGGFNFFFKRYFGLGIEGLWYGNGGAAEHMIIGNAFFRYPMVLWDLDVAPYLMIGGGAGWDHTPVGFGYVGVGGEWRLTKCFALFSDSRFCYGAPDFFGITRAGIRIVF
jgi:hypothetical protein